MTLTEFLLARIAEDAAEANKAGSFTPWDRPYERDNYGHLTVQPARVLAECEAKRRIVELASQYVQPSDAHDPGFNGGANHVGYNALRTLAAVYADHPDFREEWRP